MTVRIGTAGWSIAAAVRGRFAAEGTALGRYAGVFDAVEINSSFHRPHRPETWQRWAASVPDHFRFSVKVPKEITHARRLVDCAEPLDRFAEDVAGLGDKLAVLLVQMPPKLAFDAAVARAFFEALRARTNAAIACEPRHADWFREKADALLVELGVARVAADPPVGSDAAARPGGARTLSYWRLHGSPVVYRSSYADRIGDYAALLRADDAPEVWCMFDNTASSAATADALALSDLLRG